MWAAGPNKDPKIWFLSLLYLRQITGRMMVGCWQKPYNWFLLPRTWIRFLLPISKYHPAPAGYLFQLSHSISTAWNLKIVNKKGSIYVVRDHCSKRVDLHSKEGHTEYRSLGDTRFLFSLMSQHIRYRYSKSWNNLKQFYLHKIWYRIYITYIGI